jgi:hypothetical protein
MMPRLKKQTRARGPALSGARSRTLHSRPPLNRFQEIFHTIKTGRYPNRTQLARSIEVTTKTIQRDLDYMRYQLNLPIEFDYARGGYYFTTTVTDLPLFQLTEAELCPSSWRKRPSKPTGERRLNSRSEQPSRNFRLQQVTPVSELVLVGRISAQASLFVISARICQI